jgi:simple sugar transport system permease protein
MKPKTDPQLAFLLSINVLILLCATALSRGAFIDPYNFQSMAAQVPELGLLAIGVMLAMSSGNGGIDLSGIALANLSGVAAALLVSCFLSADADPWAFTVAFALVAIIVGLMGGLLNGLLISRLGLTPILCTLGTQMLFTGLAVVISGGVSVRVGSAEPLMEIGNGLVLGVPISFIIFCVITLMIGAILKFSPFGIRLFLMGTNAKAARYSGFSLGRILIVTYGMCGLLAGVVAVLIASRNVNVKWDYGQSYLLIAILITVMAGVKPEGGYGRMTCLFLSATALQLLSSMLNFVNVSNFFRDFAWGMLLLIFLATMRFDIKSLFVRNARKRREPDIPASTVQIPPAPKNYS